MPDIIRLLPDHVANQIAAGEVVQRPASVVKELIENAIDARATQIQLIVKDAGKTLIQLIDDGIGMSNTDARLSFERHATSKIKSADDLFHINTKGFRGEALASIAAVSHVELRTRTENSDTGTTIRIEGGKVLSQEPAVTTKGTSVLVKNLFYNIPARRNFLKSNQVELRHIVDEFQRVALAHPEIAFTMLNNGTELFRLPVVNLRQRIVGVFGSKTNEKLVPLSEETPVVTLNGFIQKPEFAKKTRNEQFFFVNRRFVKSGYLHHAVINAYEGLLKEGMQPGYFIFLELDPKSIDINIHPTKTEVKFEDEHTIYALLRSAVKHSLGQFNIVPILDFERDSTLDTPYSYKNRPPVLPKVEVDKNFNPFQESHTLKTPHPPSFKKKPAPAWESLYSEINKPEGGFFDIEAENEELNEKLIFDTDKQPDIRQILQLNNKYLIFPSKNGLVFINQHRAHRRILYEKILKSITVSRASSQQLLLPMELMFNADEILVLSEVKEQLEDSGFVFSAFEKDKVLVEGTPVFMETSEVQSILQQLLADIRNEIPESAFCKNDFLAKSLAAASAVKNGTPLEKEQQEFMVRNLFACKDPLVCPHNKPIFAIISLAELDQKLNP